MLNNIKNDIGRLSSGLRKLHDKVDAIKSLLLGMAGGSEPYRTHAQPRPNDGVVSCGSDTPFTPPPALYGDGFGRWDWEHGDGLHDPYVYGAPLALNNVSRRPPAEEQPQVVPQQQTQHPLCTQQRRVAAGHNFVQHQVSTD